MARIAPHSTPPHPPRNPPTTTSLSMGSPMVPPHRSEPHGSVEPRPHTPMALHHNAHLAPPRPSRGHHLLQHVRTRQNGQARAPLLSAPPLLPHTGAPNTNPHMPRPKPGHSLHPPLHLLPPHTRTAGTGTHSHVPESETHHLQRKRGVRHPHPATHNPGGPPHFKDIPLEPEAHQTPDWVPEDAPYTSHNRAYHYPNPIQHLARLLGDTDSWAHIQGLQGKLQILLYHTALRRANVPAHLQKRRIQLLSEQLPYLTRVARWLACKHIHVPEQNTCCPCDHTTPEDWEHFKKCPLHTGRDRLVGWTPAETVRQHGGGPTHSHAHQATEHLSRDPLVKEATMRGAVTQALHRHLDKHTESPMEAAAHLQLEAVHRAAA